MSCVGTFWSLLWGNNVTVNGETYRVVRRIGEGGFSYVELIHRQGHYYALKHMLLQVAEQRTAVEAEIQAHSMVHHRNVVQLICSEIRRNADGTYTAFLLFPYYRGGTLQDLMEQCDRSGQALPQARLLQLMICVCRGLHAMHLSSLAHRDVKPANLVLADSRDELVLMDLGSAARASVNVSSRQEALALQETCAQTCTAQYRAPELFEVPSSGTITASSDVWSLGCCIYAAAFGHSPFDGSALAAMSGRLSFPRDHSYSKELCDCIQWVLKVEPSHRPSVTQIQDKLCQILQTSS
jgi:serine/threonine kinase 16